MLEDWSVRGSSPTVNRRAGEGNGGLIPSVGHRGTGTMVARGDFHETVRLDPVWASHNVADAASRMAGTSWEWLLEDWRNGGCGRGGPLQVLFQVESPSDLGLPWRGVEGLRKACISGLSEATYLCK